MGSAERRIQLNCRLILLKENSMFSCDSCDSFTVKYSEDGQELFAKVSKLVHENGGYISSELASGEFSGSLSGAFANFSNMKGTYSVSEADKTCTIRITNKPCFVPCYAIKTLVISQLPKIEKKAAC